MVVAQLLPSMRRAGAESVVALLCQGLAEAGVEVHLVVAGGRFEYADELTDARINLHLLHLYEGPIRFYRFDIHRRISKSLLAFLGQLRPEVLHCHLSHSLIWASPAAARLGLKTFYTIHGNPAINGRGLKAWWRRREFVRAVRTSRCRLLAVSKSAARHMEDGLGLAAQSIAVQPNPIDLEKWQPPLTAIISNPFGVIMVGTLYHLKRVHIAIQVLNILSTAFPEARLEIAGDGPERANLEELVRSLGLQERVSFLGVRRDIPELLKEAGVLWLLSEREGMPMVMLEAMASGVPVVATDKPGTNEFIRDGDNGLLVPQDDHQAVAAATSRIWRDTHLRERLRANGLTYVRQFGLPNIVQQHLAHYQSFTARP